MDEAPTPTGRADPMDRMIQVLIVLACLGAVAYGVYLIVARQSRQLGPFIVGVGLAFIPIPLVSVIGGLVMLGTGIYCLTIGVMLYGILFSLFGLMTIADRGRGIGASRRT